MDKATREQIFEIIREEVAKDRGVIAAEIGQTIQKRLNIRLSNNQLNAYRKQIGLNSLALFEEDFHRQVSEAAMRLFPKRR